jgi:hypothetical protein
MRSVLVFAITGALTFSTACNAYGQNPPQATVWINAGVAAGDDFQAAALKRHAPVTFTSEKDSATQIVTLTVTDGGISNVTVALLVPLVLFMREATPMPTGDRYKVSLVVTDAETHAVVLSRACTKSKIKTAAVCVAKQYSKFVDKGKH